MGNIFVNLPVPAANGSGAAVDMSAFGPSKTVSVVGPFQGTVTVEISNEAVPTQWAPLLTFNNPDGFTVDCACHWMRATVSGYKNGTPACDVGGTDDGALFAAIAATAGNGVGPAVDTTALGIFKTVTVGGPFRGNVQLEISENGTSRWSQVGFGFSNPGQQSQVLAAAYIRAVRSGVPDIEPGYPIIDVAACELGGGGGAAASQVLSLYGDGSFGDYVTAGDETWTSLSVPGAPVLPVGAPIEAAFFDNLTVSAGDALTIGGLSDAPTERAVVIYVKDTLTIEAGGSINASGGVGGTSVTVGLGRNAIVGAENGGDGGAGALTFGPYGGAAGVGGTNRPAQSTATMVGGAGGAGGLGGANAGGAGGAGLTPASWPYSLTQAFGIGALLYKIGGGNGGGGGGGSVNSSGGGGGGGGGTLVIFAKTIVAPAGSLRALGGDGGPSFTTELDPGGGGGGGSGGTIIIVTENTTLVGTTDVSGGAGGSDGGLPPVPGLAGGPGEAIAFNPTLAAQIPV